MLRNLNYVFVPFIDGKSDFRYNIGTGEHTGSFPEYMGKVSRIGKPAALGNLTDRHSDFEQRYGVLDTDPADVIPRQHMICLVKQPPQMLAGVSGGSCDRFDAERAVCIVFRDITDRRLQPLARFLLMGAIVPVNQTGDQLVQAGGAPI